MALKRTFYKDGGLTPNRANTPSESILVSSRLTDGRHAPAIDVDGIEVAAAPSRTQGNYHLYIEKPMKWWRYRLLLWAFKVAGIIEPGYYRMAVKRGASMLRSRQDFYPGSANPRAHRYRNEDVGGFTYEPRKAASTLTL